MKKIAFHTLGCKLNFSETSTLARLFNPDFFEHSDFNEESDYYVINTCLVTEKAERKCRDVIKKTHNRFPKGKIIVVGCYAQLKAQELSEMPGVSLVLGNAEKFDLVKFVEEAEKEPKNKAFSCDISEARFAHSYSVGDRTRSFLKIQDGCDYKCAYCTIPLARGNSRNPAITEIVDEAKIIALKGVKEIILTGVNIGDFGKSTGENFYRLLSELNEKVDIPRIRISSIEPNLVTREIIELVAKSDKIMPHFHIPLQAASDKVLKLMQRRYLRKVFEDVVKEIISEMPLASVGSDVIVGFPGETDEDFMEGLDFLKNQELAYLHVFSYSRRKNTKAFDFPNQVSANDMKARSNLLHELSAKKTIAFFEKNMGTEHTVLFENRKSGNELHGFTDNYIKVYAPFDEKLKNNIRTVVLTKIKDENCMWGGKIREC